MILFVYYNFLPENCGMHFCMVQSCMMYTEIAFAVMLQFNFI